MPVELYLAFVVASAVLILLPGPIVSLVIATSLSQGVRRGLLVVAGTSAATMCQLVIVVAGASSVLLVLAGWFEWLRWAGVAYLVWLGLREWRAAANGQEGLPERGSSRGLFVRGFFVSATNPKTLLFYAAFFPQFLDRSLPLGPQLVTLSITFLAIAITFDSAYALLAGHIGNALRSPRLARLRHRISGTLLIGAGIGLALARRS